MREFIVEQNFNVCREGKTLQTFTEGLNAELWSPYLPCGIELSAVSFGDNNMNANNDKCVIITKKLHKILYHTAIHSREHFNPFLSQAILFKICSEHPFSPNRGTGKTCRM